MIKKYIYAGTTYLTEYEVRSAIYQATRTVFGEAPEENAADWWNAFDVEYVEEDEPTPPEPTPEEIAAAELERAKAERAAAVAAIKVTVDDMTFDGDEVAQSRMARALTAAEAAGQDSTVWVLADNTVATVTKAQLAQALALSMEEMAKVWTKPYAENA